MELQGATCGISQQIDASAGVHVVPGQVGFPGLGVDPVGHVSELQVAFGTSSDVPIELKGIASAAGPCWSSVAMAMDANAQSTDNDRGAALMARCTTRPLRQSRQA